MKNRLWLYVYGVMGAFIIGFGVAVLSKAGFGLDAFSSFIGNLVLMTEKSFRLFNFLIGICFVIINTFVNKKRFNFFAIIIAFIIGVSVDLFIPLLVNVGIGTGMFLRILWFILGVFIYGFGVAVLIKSTMLSPLEEYMMAIKKIFHTSIAKSKFVTDLSLIIYALFVGGVALHSFGQVGMGTIIITLFAGKIIDIYLNIFNKLKKKKGNS